MDRTLPSHFFPVCHGSTRKTIDRPADQQVWNKGQQEGDGKRRERIHPAKNEVLVN